MTMPEILQYTIYLGDRELRTKHGVHIQKIILYYLFSPKCVLHNYFQESHLQGKPVEHCSVLVLQSKYLQSPSRNEPQQLFVLQVAYETQRIASLSHLPWQ